MSQGTPNQYPTGTVTADMYLDASGESGASSVKAGSFAWHRDGNDAAGQERWDTWFNTSMNCTRELYWDDNVSLGHKYALVNQDNLRGVGIWTLNYAGGVPELWSLLDTYLPHARQIGFPDQLISGYATRARVARLRGEHELALRVLEEAIQFARERSFEKLLIMLSAEFLLIEPMWN